MKIDTRKEEDVVILEVDGRIDIEGGDVKLREKVQGLLDDGAKKILLDLGKVRLIDSSGLGELVRCKKRAADHDATIKLLHVEDRVHKVLEMTRLIGVFDTYDDEIDAVASFRG